MENNPNQIKQDNKSIHTLSEDMIRLAEEKRGSVIQEIIENEENKNSSGSQSPQANKYFTLLGIFFLFLAFGILFYLFFLENKKEGVNVSTLASSYFFVEKQNTLEVSDLPKEKILPAVFSLAESSLIKEDEIENIFLTQNQSYLSFENFSKTLELSLSADDMDSFAPFFMIGAEGEEKNVFMFLSSTSFDSAFGTLRSWEKKMFYDLHDLWNLPLNQNTNYLTTTDFVDVVVQNKNARALYDENKNLIFMYVFLDENFVLFTNNKDFVKEVVARLSSGRVRK